MQRGESERDPRWGDLGWLLFEQLRRGLELAWDCPEDGAPEDHGLRLSSKKKGPPEFTPGALGDGPGSIVVYLD